MYSYKNEFIKIIVVKKINGELFQISKDEAIKRGLKYYEITSSEYKSKLELYKRVPSKNFVMHPDIAKEQGLLYTQNDIENWLLYSQQNKIKYTQKNIKNWLDMTINDTINNYTHNDKVTVVKKINGEVVQMLKLDAIRQGLKYYEITLSEYKNKQQLYIERPSKNFVMNPKIAKEQGLLYTEQDRINWRMYLEQTKAFDQGKEVYVRSHYRSKPTR